MISYYGKRKNIRFVNRDNKIIIYVDYDWDYEELIDDDKNNEIKTIYYQRLLNLKMKKQVVKLNQLQTENYNKEKTTKKSTRRKELRRQLREAMIKWKETALNEKVFDRDCD